MIDLMLQAVIPPALVSLIVLTFAWRPWTGNASSVDGRWGTVIACGAGYVAAFCAVVLVSRDVETGAWSWNQWERWHWIVVVVGGSTVVSLVTSRLRAGVWPSVLAGLAGTVFILTLLNQWDQGGLLMWRAGGAGSALLSWAVMEPLSRVRRGVSLPLALVMVFTTAAVVLLLSGNEKMFRLCAGASAALGGCVVFALWRPQFSMSGGAMIVVLVMLLGHLELGRAYSYSAVPFAAYLLPVVAPMTLWLGELPAVRGRRPWLAVIIRVLIVGVPLGGAIFLAQRAVDTSLY